VFDGAVRLNTALSHVVRHFGTGRLSVGAARGDAYFAGGFNQVITSGDRRTTQPSRVRRGDWSSSSGKGGCDRQESQLRLSACEIRH
jgi:hypothetical protein